MGFTDVLGALAGVAMAIGPPLAYTDQFIDICRKHTSAGFSTDVCAVLIIANVTRCVYWLGDHFQVYLLVQSILMIMAQFSLLYVCIIYRPSSFYSERRRRRLGDFWEWPSFGAYLEFVALLLLIQCAFFLILYKIPAYVQILGFIALGLEATLPIPQLLANYEKKSTAGFRLTVLAGWFIGDAVKTIYFFVTPDNGIAFKACACFQLSVDTCLVIQTYLYRHQTASDLAERATLRQHQGVAGAEALLHAAHAGEHESDDEHEHEHDAAAAERERRERAQRRV